MDDLSTGEAHHSSPTGVNPVAMTRSDEPITRTGEFAGGTDPPLNGPNSPQSSADSSAEHLAESEPPEDRTESVLDEGLPRDADSSGGDSADAGEPLNAGELIERHQRGVWRYLRMLGCDEATADDLTQETFLRVLRRADFVQHNDSATAGYLRRTAYNLLVSRHRKLGRIQTIAEPELLDESWDRWAGKDLSGDEAVEALRDCFNRLTERAQIALRMRFDSSASRIQIGEALGISDHGARNLMQRAKQQLRNCVEEKLQLVNEP